MLYKIAIGMFLKTIVWMIVFATKRDLNADIAITIGIY